MEYNVRDYGAIGDGETLDTVSVQDAIDECTEAGGGTVCVPAGDYRVGTIQLKSNVALFLASGATLIGSTEEEDYHSGGTPMTSLLVSKGAENIAIRGDGVIDAQGSEFMDMNDVFTPSHDPAAMTAEHSARQGEDYLDPKWGTEDGPVRPLEWRPDRVLYFHECDRVKIQGVTIQNAPNWTLHFLGCKDLRITGINIYNDLRIPNTDGINPDLCENIHISDCTVITGDDAICPKATEGLGYEGSLENLTVTNCILRSRSSAIKFGSATAHDIENCTFENIIVRGSNRGLAIQHRDSGSIRNISFSNIVVETQLHTGHWWGKAEPIWVTSIPRHEGHDIGSVENIRFTNVNATSESGIVVYGTPESRIRDVELDGVSVAVTDSAKSDASGGNFDFRPTSLFPPVFESEIPGFYAEYVQDLDIDSFHIEWEEDIAQYHSHAVECESVEDLLIENFKGKQAPRSPDKASLAFRDTSDITIRGSKALHGTKTFIEISDSNDARLFANNDLTNAETAFQGDGEAFMKSGNILPAP
ncbi:glycoside hydrolase family 28 protein [Haloarcula amylovorans]|uniref:glycoside hydrolase family 28 protein n=1 Tax=Haloarcula amylovorans TaxID=2562280 RepID=UPI0010760B66|nr:glycosyl hydrolase family 28 protein [Halomicroarcula amylolytica]